MSNKMDVIINKDSIELPEKSQPIKSEGSLVLNLLECLGFDPEDPPIAQVLSNLHQLSGSWLILSPVRWEATHNDGLIEQINLSEDESQMCFKAFAEYLSEENRTLHYHAPDLWLLCCDNLPPIKAKPIHYVANKSLMPALSTIDATMFWQKFITESQMFFASQGMASAVNGVWVWGGATFSEKKMTSICADTSHLDLAKLCSIQVKAYSPSVEISEFQLLLIDDTSSLSAPHLQQLNKNNVNWYWNNRGYNQNNLNWITRFWRTMIHAD